MTDPAPMTESEKECSNARARVDELMECVRDGLQKQLADAIHQERLASLGYTTDVACMAVGRTAAAMDGGA